MIKQTQMCVTTAAAVRSFHSKKGKKSTGCFFCTAGPNYSAMELSAAGS